MMMKGKGVAAALCWRLKENTTAQRFLPMWLTKPSVAQVIELCNQPFTAKSRIRMMPDIHAGAGALSGQP